VGRALEPFTGSGVETVEPEEDPMRILTIRRAAVAAVLPLALGALAACGGTSSSTTADTAAPTSSPTSDTSTGSGATTGTDAKEQTVDSARFLAMLKAGAQKLTTAKFSMTMDASGQQISADGALDMTGSTPAMKISMDLTGMGTPTEMILLGGTMYIAMPNGNGTFVKMDLTDPNGPMGSLGNALGGLDPKSLMDQLSPDVFKKVVYDGTETVRGQQLKRYSVTLDASSVPMLKGMPSSSTASLPKTMTYDMWLDDQGRMAQFKMLMKKVVSMTMTYSDFGAPVDIKAPDPSKVQSMPGTSS
jgi:LppX_LprAFG lipoprotein